MGRETVAGNFVGFAVARLVKTEGDITRCCDQLTEEQMWWRGGEHENSVANLLLHLAGNMRQWIMHGIAGQPDVRERDEEFVTAPVMEASEARRIFAIRSRVGRCEIRQCWRRFFRWWGMCRCMPGR